LACFAIAQSSKKIEELNNQAIELIQDGESKKAIDLLETILPSPNIDHANIMPDYIATCDALATAYEHVDLPNKTIEIAELGLAIIQSNNLEDEYVRNVIFFYEYLFVNHTKLSNYSQAQINALNLLDVLKRYSINNDFFNLAINNTIGIVNMKSHNHPLALKYFHKSLSLSHQLADEYYTAKPYIYQNLSQIHNQLNNADSAAYYLDKAIAIFESNKEDFEKDFFAAYATAANRQIANENLDRAALFIKMAAPYRYSSNSVTDLAYYHRTKALYIVKSAMPDSAAHEITEARRLLEWRDEHGDIQTYYLNEYMDVRITDLIVSEIKNKETYYKAAVETMDDVERLIQQSLDPSIKASAYRNSKAIYFHVIHSIYQLQQSGTAADSINRTLISAFEQAHASLLNADLNMNAWTSARQDHPEVKDYRELLYKQNELTSQLSTTDLSVEDSSTYVEIVRKKINLDEQIIENTNQLKSKFPDLQALLNQSDVLTNDELELVKNTFDNVITYFKYDDDMFVLHVFDDKLELHHLPNADSISLLINQWNELLTRAEITERHTQSMHQIGNLLYDKLLGPIDADFGESILIIPDEDLASISFAALNRNMPSQPYDYLSADYLTSNHTLTYHYSLKLAAQMISHSTQERRPPISFTPTIGEVRLAPTPMSDTIILPPLYFSNAEAQLIVDELDGEILSNINHVDSFIFNLKHRSLFHIGSHVILHNEFPDQSMLPYFDSAGHLQTFNSYEFYKEPLDIDLTIVNACHAGAGQTTAGRGLLSFVSGLARAEVKSIISPKWTIEDRLGKVFFEDLISNLNKSLSACKALRQTQVNIIERNDPIQSHPRYWAPYFLIGDPDVEIGQNTQIGKWFIYGSLLALLLFFIWRYIGKQNKNA